MADYRTNSSVLFLIFNRPDTTALVFEQIKKVKPTRLYIAADGPRLEKDSDAELCFQVLNVVKNVDWECDVKRLYRDINLGCKNAVSSAIDWFFEYEQEGIILEDDCLPATDFFRFCDEMLIRYRDDTRIRHIAGCNLQLGKKWGEASYYYANQTHVWGWATWKRVWNDYDKNLNSYDVNNTLPYLDTIFQDSFLAAEWKRIFVALKNGEIDTWDYQLALINYFNNSLSINPNVNLIQNIGFRADGTHTISMDNPYANQPLGKLNKVTHPLFILPEKKADYAVFNRDFNLEYRWKRHNLLRRRFKRWIKKSLETEDSIIVHKERIEIRRKPVNLTDADIKLFEKADALTLSESPVLKLKNVDVLKDVIFSRQTCQFFIPYTHHRKIAYSYLGKRLLSIVRSSKNISKAIWITDEWSKEYFHWFTDALSRFISLHAYNKDYTLILPESYNETAYIVASLEKLGVKVSYYNPKTRLHIDELLLPAHIAPTGNYNSEIINIIRNAFLAEPTPEATRKIYISREKAAKRKIINEIEVQHIMIQHGYEIHHFEDYSFQQQLNIMSETGSLVSLHGAGLTNMLFMKAESQILEIRNQNDTHNNCFFSLASALQHNYYYLCAEGDSELTHEVNVVVDVNQLTSVLKLMHPAY